MSPSLEEFRSKEKMSLFQISMQTGQAVIDAIEITQ